MVFSVKGILWYCIRWLGYCIVCLCDHYISLIALNVSEHNISKAELTKYVFVDILFDHQYNLILLSDSCLLLFSNLPVGLWWPLNKHDYQLRGQSGEEGLVYCRWTRQEKWSNTMSRFFSTSNSSQWLRRERTTSTSFGSL